ncbi:hypothetical protein ACFU98_37425 [Streptomyces sp. NPDC057575]|uniref:hypothetical protein n=1 Tax=unclassified Streptomyces TaxID=2593676 RepID=UPI0036C6AD19
MAKKPKNRSSRRTKQDHQTRNRVTRHKREEDAASQAVSEAFDRAFEAGWFTAVDPQGQPVRLTLDAIRRATDAQLAGDGEPPVEGVDELRAFLVEDLDHGGLVLRPDGLWDVLPEYLAQADAERV